MADKLDLEETNRVRLSLGMQPLPSSNSGSSKLNFKASDKKASSDSDSDPGSTLDSRQALASENWQKLQAEADKKKRREEQRAQIKKKREAAQKYAKLEGKGLGDADDDGVDDTKAWLLGSQKRQKKIAKEKARKIAQELAEREQAAGYTEKDLAGAKVGHELGDFDDETEQILTLKDATVDAKSDEDELENANLREKEKLKERLDLKKKKPVYDPHAEDAEGKSVLAHYDEEIDDKKKKHFTLNESGAPSGLKKAVDDEDAVPGRTKISLDFLYADTKPASDYQDMSEIKIKKRKQKKEKSQKRRRVDDDLDDMFQTQNGSAANEPADAMDVEANGSLPRGKHEDTTFVDDEDLQAQLASQRREALKKRKRMRPEDIARELREEGLETAAGGAMDIKVEGDDEEEGGLIIDETQQFVENLKPRPPKEKKAVPTVEDDPDGPPSDAEMADTDGNATSHSTSQHDRRDSSTAPTAPTAPGGPSHTGLEDEGTLNKGIGSTLSMLTGRGLLKTALTGDSNAVFRDRQRFLAEKQKAETGADLRARMQRERDRASGRFERMSAREREQYAQQANTQREHQESRAAAEMFNRDYKPSVELKYTDDFGRSMNQKEAFKHLSHQFHGKGSGKQKTEKQIKKVEEEKAREARSTLDASQATGMNSAAGMTAKKNKRAGVRLQ